MKTLIRELLVAFPDWHVTVEDMFGQDKGGDALELARDAPCSLSRHPGDRARESRRRNSYRSYRRRQDRQTLGLQQLHRRLQRAQGARLEIARMQARVGLGNVRSAHEYSKKKSAPNQCHSDSSMVIPSGPSMNTSLREWKSMISFLVLNPFPKQT